ncbi:MAG TPA: hypothetical protein VH417_13065 [Vicinamibacterales bacterium]|jgi:hypothetical protein
MSNPVAPLPVKSLVVAALLIAAGSASRSTDLRLIASLSAQQQPASSPVPAGVVRMQGDPSSASIQSGALVGNLTYHFGPVQHTQKIFTIFWQGGGTPFPSAYQTTINQFVRDLSYTPYYGIASQYNDSAAKINPTLAFGGTWLDTTNPLPSAALASEDLLAEVNRAKAANGWTSDANSYFQIYTPAGVASTFSGICGLHYFANPAFGQIIFPQPGCFPAAPYPNDAVVDAAINISAHEILETVTDPQGNAWFFQNSGGEIGDLCAWMFGTRAGDGSNVIMNGHPYVVQMEWSNAISGCTLTSVLPSAIITANGQGDPLTLHAGSPLQLTIAATGGTPGFANPSDVYVGVAAPFGLLWLGGGGFTTATTALYHGPLANFGPLTLLTVPNVSALPPGDYLWFIAVTGPSGTFSDVVQTTIQP